MYLCSQNAKERDNIALGNDAVALVLAEGAAGGDYSEPNELHGCFQLVMSLADGLHVRSNIVAILDTPEPAPVRVQIYDSRGMPVRESRVTYGIYLYRYEQDGRVWTEKKLIQ